jgi:nucleotide-binding universal stress UspA family protein
MTPNPQRGAPRRRRKHRFVVGYDGSAAAADAVRWAADQARRGGRVIVVHAREPGLPRPLVSSAPARARASLEALYLDNDALADAEVELRVADDPPATALCRLAAEIDADAIVVGRHQGGVFAADTVRELLRRSDRAVTVVP